MRTSTESVIDCIDFRDLIKGRLMCIVFLSKHSSDHYVLFCHDRPCHTSPSMRHHV